MTREEAKKFVEQCKYIGIDNPKLEIIEAFGNGKIIQIYYDSQKKYIDCHYDYINFIKSSNKYKIKK